jgi:hypothetical protein
MVDKITKELNAMSIQISQQMVNLRLGGKVNFTGIFFRLYEVVNYIPLQI